MAPELEETFNEEPRAPGFFLQKERTVDCMLSRLITLTKDSSYFLLHLLFQQEFLEYLLCARPLLLWDRVMNVVLVPKLIRKIGKFFFSSKFLLKFKLLNI